MGVTVNIQVHMNTDKIAKEFEALKDDNVMYLIHNEFKRMCNPYVPMKEGVLSQEQGHDGSVEVTKDHVRYFAKDPDSDISYAHYMYVGEVYGPNIPIYEHGILVGFWSPPGKKKHPTGRPINYSKEFHALATKEWDKAMMRDHGDEYIANVKKILLDRFKELYG